MEKRITVDGFTFYVSPEGHVRRENGKTPAVGKNSKGYLRIDATKKIGDKRIRRKYSIHKLVALAFVPNPLQKPHINHKDGDKTNNSATNLEWCTAAENNIHAIKSGLRTHFGMKGVSVKLTKEDGKSYSFCSILEATKFLGGSSWSLLHRNKIITREGTTYYAKYGK